MAGSLGMAWISFTERSLDSYGLTEPASRFNSSSESVDALMSHVVSTPKMVDLRSLLPRNISGLEKDKPRFCK